MSILAKLRNYIKNTKNDWNYITPYDFYTKYYSNQSKNKRKYVVIDLRKKRDYETFHIPYSKNIFWLELLSDKNLKRLSNYIKKNKKIFLICYVGHTSSQAMVLLKLLGISVTSIKFGYGISPVKTAPISGWLQCGYPVTGNKDLLHI
jgi:rhodanese-related sulfurtransferase